MELFSFSRKDSSVLAAGWEKRAEDSTVCMVVFYLILLFLASTYPAPPHRSLLLCLVTLRFSFSSGWSLGVGGLSGCGEWGEDLGSSCPFYRHLVLISALCLIPFFCSTCYFQVLNLLGVWLSVLAPLFWVRRL